LTNQFSIKRAGVLKIVLASGLRNRLGEVEDPRSHQPNCERISMMMRTVSTMTAAAVLLAFSNVFAQSEVPVPVAPVPPAVPQATAPAPPAPATAPVVEQEKMGEKYKDGDEQKGKGKGKNKGKGRGKDGNKMRGLDRADEMAGDHGKEGRDNARGRGKRGKD
jgi:hypothetical protein